MAELITYKFNKLPVRIIRFEDGEEYFVIRDICNILSFSNPNRILAMYTENVPMYERIPTPGGLQVVRLVPYEDVERILTQNKGRKALHLKHWLKNKILPQLEADKKALTESRSLAEAFVSVMQMFTPEQCFFGKSGGCNGRCK